jgi:Cof subfamily protein (haloacid dehalogenase superfamily)
LPVGGVYLQGLIVYKGMDVIFERTLDTDITLAVLRFARERQISFIAFNGDRILCQKMDATIAGVTAQHEPMPEVADLENLLQPKNTDTQTHTPTTIHKVILLGTPQQITAIRPDLQKFVGDSATLTQAQSDMVEVLPKGASKGEGVKKLLEALKVHPHNVLAIGDQENDIEMLKLVNVSVAMGNAPEHVKKVAKYETEGNEVEGAAKAFERFCGV